MTEWKVSSNYIGKKVYQVYRLIDESKVDHSGNREFYHQIFDTVEEAQAKADELNEDAAWEYYEEELESLPLEEQLDRLMGVE